MKEKEVHVIREDLDSIEKLRTFITHNRTEANTSQEINFAEQYSYERVNDLLSVAEWYNNAVVLHDFWQTGIPSTTFNSLADLKAHLLDIANDTATANFPSSDDDRETYERLYNGEVLVDKVLTEYKKELIVLGWI